MIRGIRSTCDVSRQFRARHGKANHDDHEHNYESRCDRFR